MNGASVTITDAAIYGNSAPYGGGLAFVAGVLDKIASRAVLRRVLIHGNTASVRGSSGSGFGGGIHIDASELNITDQTRIYNNDAKQQGGGIRVYGANVTIDGQSSIDENHVYSNSHSGLGQVGGGLMVCGTQTQRSVVTINGQSLIRNNTARDTGGGLQVQMTCEGYIVASEWEGPSRVRITGQSIISGNRATVRASPRHHTAVAPLSSLTPSPLPLYAHRPGPVEALAQRPPTSWSPTVR